MIKNLLFISSAIIFVVTSIIIFNNYQNNQQDIISNTDLSPKYKIIPFSQWQKSPRLIDLTKSTPLASEDIDNFLFINQDFVSKYVISEDEINHLYTIPNSKDLDLNEHINEFTSVIYENLLIDEYKNQQYLYSYNVTGQELTYSIDTWKTFCQIFVEEDRQCEIGSMNENGTSIGIITITNKGIITILEPKNQAYPFTKSSGVFETYGNSLGVYSHFTPMKYIEDDDNDDINKFTYNFKSYLEDLFTYDFTSVENYIFNDSPYIHYKDWPTVVFLDFVLRSDLSKYKKIIVDALENEESKKSPIITFTLNDLTKITLEGCSQFKIPIETCKKITRLWFYLYIVEKIPHNIKLIIVKKDIDLRRSKIISLTRNRLI